MAIKTYKPTTPSRPDPVGYRILSLSKVAPERSLLQPLNRKVAAATPTAESPFVIVAAVTQKNTV